MIAIVASLAAIALTIVGLIVKLSFFAAEQRLMLQQVQKDLDLVRHIPVMIFRISRLEQEVGLTSIEIPLIAGKKDV